MCAANNRYWSVSSANTGLAKKSMNTIVRSRVMSRGFLLGTFGNFSSLALATLRLGLCRYCVRTPATFTPPRW